MKRYEVVDTGYLCVVYGRPQFLERVQDAYDYLEKNTNIVETLWNKSPETAWCDLVKFNGGDNVYAIAGDTEINADGMFYIVPFIEAK